MDSRNNYTSKRQSLFSKLCDWFFSRLRFGLIGRVFTSYDKRNKRFSDAFEKKSVKTENPISRRLAKRLETSKVIGLFSKLLSLLLRTQLRQYGIVFFSMPLFLIILYFGQSYLEEQVVSVAELIFCSILAVLSFFLIFSKKTLAQFLLEKNFITHILFDLIGFKTSVVQDASEQSPVGISVLALIIGLLFGGLSLFITPWWVILSLLIILLIYEILTAPEVGVIMLILLVPFLNAFYLSAVVLLTMFSYVVKLFVGKRTFKVEYFDLVVISVFSVALITSFFSFDLYNFASIAFPKLLFIASFFLISNLIRNKDWFSRAVRSIAFSAMISFVILLLNVFYNFVKEQTGWTYDIYSASSIISAQYTYELSPSFGYNIVMILPFLLVFLFTKRADLRTLYAFLNVIMAFACLVISDAGFSFVGCIVASLFLLLIAHRQTFGFSLLTLAIPPILYYALPTETTNRILHYLSSRGISLQPIVKDLKNCLQTILAHPFGLGIGTKEVAPSLFFQVLLETGFIGGIVFLFFLFNLARLNFSYLIKPSNKYRVTNATCGFCSVVGFLALGLFVNPFERLETLFFFVVCVSLNFAYIKIERENQRPTGAFFDIAKATIELTVLRESAKEIVPQRKYVKVLKEKEEKADSYTKEFQTMVEFDGGDDNE